METVAIVGTGLIGASFGLALKRAGFAGPILGVSSASAAEAALARGAIDEIADLESAVGRAQVVFLSPAIGRILDIIPRLDALVCPGALITDAGSTKRRITDLAARHIQKARFLGGHPMAGKESRGPATAEPGLFEGRTWLLTPREPHDMETPQARWLTGWLERIGARVAVLSPEQHDQAVARTSHLPQLLSTALAATLQDTLADSDLAAAGPGLHDMTRLAGSSWDVWSDILATNQEPVAAALDDLIARLRRMRGRLGGDLAGEFAAGASLRNRLRQ